MMVHDASHHNSVNGHLIFSALYEQKNPSYWGNEINLTLVLQCKDIQPFVQACRF
jgi:hypothetical protein